MPREKHTPDKPETYRARWKGWVDEISIECAQPRLDLRDLESLPGKAVHVGVIDLRDTEIESPETVAARLRAALRHLPPERIVVAPDCGMKYLTPKTARGKLNSMVAGRNLVLRELGLE
jgi:5-methyltetrahydropteroyltriglutamate--homocysteine methyltransferase